MANLDDLFQLDPLSAGNNSNSNFAGANVQELCSPSGLNNALRALGSMAARAICYQGSAISSSVSTNLVTASSGLAVAVLGANAVNSFGLVPGEMPSAAVLRIVEFSSSASLSHGGSLFLTGGASRKTQPGDVGIYLHQGSSDRWKEITFSRADGTLPMDSLSVTTITNRSLSTSAISTMTLNAASASITAIGITALNSLNSVSASIINATAYRVGGLTMQHVLQVATASNANYSTTSSTIPIDNTLPQIDEGLPVLDVAITPKSGSSTLWFHGTAPIGVGTQAGAVAAVFSNSASDAIFAAASFPVGGSNMHALNFTFSHPAGNTTARTYRLRVGMSSGAVFLNGDQTSRLLGGASKATLKIEEIL